MHGAKWTPELDAEIIRLRHEKRLTAAAIAPLVNRKVGAVFARFRNLDALVMDRREWSADDVARLVKLVGDEEKTIRAIADELGRNENSVRWKLDHLGIKPNRRQDWTPEQITLLRDAFARDPKISNADLAKAVGRSETSVASKVGDLNLRPARNWTPDEIAKLRAARSLDDAVQMIGRERGSVLAKVYALEIRFPDAQDTAWTEVSKARLRELIEERGQGDNALATIAAELGRTVRAIKVQARKLDLVERKRRRRPLDAAGRAEIVDAAKSGMSITVAIKALGRDVRILRKIAEEEGVAFKAAVRAAVPKVARPRPTKPAPMPAVSPFVAYAKPAVAVPSAREVKAELVRLAAASTVPVTRMATPAPKMVQKRPSEPTEVRRAPKVAHPEVKVATAPAVAPAPVVAKSIGVAPVAEPVRDVAYAKTGKRSFNSFVRSSGKDGGRDAALALRANTADAVAQFLAKRGATKATVDPVEATIAAIRGRGYSLISQGDGFVVDGRHHLADDAALFAFAEIRGLQTPPALQAAE